MKQLSIFLILVMVGQGVFAAPKKNAAKSQAECAKHLALPNVYLAGVLPLRQKNQ